MKALLLVVVVVLVAVVVFTQFSATEITSGIENTMSVTSDMVYVAEEAMPDSGCLSYDLANAVGAIDMDNPCEGGR